MKYLIPIFFLLGLTSLQSQNLWLKGYVGVAHAPRLNLSSNFNPNNIFVNEQGQSFLVAIPAIALELKGKDFWEMGAFWKGKKSKQADGLVAVPPADSIQYLNYGETTSKSLEVHVEYNISVTENKEKRLQTFIGFSFNPRWAHFDFKSSKSYIYSAEANILGAGFGIVPRLQYALKNGLKLDLNLAINALNAQYNTSARRNPALTTRQQESRIFEVGYFNGYALRAGLAWKIRTKKTATVTNSNSGGN